MGGFGSGRHRLTDEEKKARGTFRADESEAATAARNAAKVITGPWLTSIPDPEMPLNEVGLAKYHELARMLFEGNKLTKVTCMKCEMAAVLWQKIKDQVGQGRKVSDQTIAKLDSILRELRVAEDAPAIANPNQKNKFASLGTANRVLSTFRLRTPSAS